MSLSVNNAAWTLIGNGPAYISVTSGTLMVSRSRTKPANNVGAVAVTPAAAMMIPDTGPIWVIGTSSTATVFTDGPIPPPNSAAQTFNLVKFDTYTVATLPSAAANLHAICAVSDATSVTNGATAVGGGSNNAHVKSNGTAWIILG